MSSLPRRKQRKIENRFDSTGQMGSIGEMRNLKVLEMGDGTLDLRLQSPEGNTQGRLAWLSDLPGLESFTKQKFFNEHKRLHGAGGSLLTGLYLGRWVRSISTSLLSSETLNQIAKT